MKILKKIIKAGLISGLALSVTLLLVGPVMAGEKLVNMNELPALRSNNSETYRYKSVQDQNEKSIENDIVILYKDRGENNIGSLSLDKSDFAAGSTLNEQVDVLRAQDKNQVDRIIDQIRNNSNVLAVDRDSKAKILDVPNDKYLNQYQSYLSSIGYESTWNLPSKNQVKVAVLDTGIRKDHDDLKNRIDDSGQNYTNEEYTDTQGHGTAVASVVCAETNNGIGISGTAGISDVKVVDFKIGDNRGESSISDMVTAMTDVANRNDIKVVNLSFGIDKYVETMDKAAKLLEENGKVFVCASGNTNEGVYYPAALDTAIATGAVNDKNQRCTPADWGNGYGSCYGKELKIVAPGNKIAVADNSRTDSYSTDSGTSFSTPIVAGGVALLFGQNPNLSPAQIKDTLYTTAQDLGPAGRDNEYGYGLIRLDKAYEKLKELPDDQIIVDNPNLTVVLGKTEQIKAHSLGGAALSYQSSDTKVARVDSNGIVTPVSEGTCTIKISIASKPTISANCNVTVVQNTFKNVFRLYNKVSGEHLYTTDQNEINSLTSQPDWENEGVKWNSPEIGDPVYRLYSLITTYHLYTSDNSEVKTLLDSGAWEIDNNNEPIFYSDGNNNIYRLYNEGLKMHLLTTDQEEYNTLPSHGWTQEGIKFKCQ